MREGGVQRSKIITRRGRKAAKRVKKMKLKEKKLRMAERVVGKITRRRMCDGMK